MTTELFALADRVEAAKAWDIALDEAVAVAMGWQRPMLPGTCGPDYEGRNRYEWHDTDQQPRGFYPPQFTASLDAALTIYDAIRHIEWIDGGVEAYCFGGTFDSAVYLGYAVTAPLALTAAALRAHASRVGDGRGE